MKGTTTLNSIWGVLIYWLEITTSLSVEKAFSYFIYLLNGLLFIIFMLNMGMLQSVPFAGCASGGCWIWGIKRRRELCALSCSVIA